MNFAFFWDTTPDILAAIYQFFLGGGGKQISRNKKKTKLSL